MKNAAFFDRYCTLDTLVLTFLYGDKKAEGTTLAFLRYRVFALIAQNPMKFRKGETEKAKVALICGTNTNNLFSRHQQWYICDTLLHTMWALGPIRIV